MPISESFSQYNRVSLIIIVIREHSCYHEEVM